MSKIGVIHYNWPGFSFDQFLDYAAQIGCTHVELHTDDIEVEAKRDASTQALQEAAQKTRARVETRGLKVSALSAGNDFIQSDAGEIEAQVAWMRRVCHMTRVLGEEAVVRSEGGAAKDSMSEEQQWDSMRECFSKCVPFLEELEVSLAIDNHGTVTNNGDKLINLLQHLNHPRIGSNLDTMNFRWLGNSIEDCDRFYRELAPHVLHAHLKDGFGAREEYKGAALGEGEIHLQVALDALKATGFNGVYTAEYEGSELDGTGYKKCVDWLKSHV